jgi:phosphoglycolate phosphatase-like HAD superfamily hydrolase
MATERIAVLFDIDGTLLVTGGAGAASWRLAFEELYGIPADIGAFTDAGMTDPGVGRKTFEAVMKRKPERKDFARLLERRLHYLHQTVADSKKYRVLAGVEALLPKLIDEGYLLGLVTGNVEAAAHIKLHRAQLNRFFSFGGYGSDSTDRGELTKIALKRATLVYGELDSSNQAKPPPKPDTQRLIQRRRAHRNDERADGRTYSQPVSPPLHALATYLATRAPRWTATGAFFSLTLAFRRRGLLRRRN